MLAGAQAAWCDSSGAQTRAMPSEPPTSARGFGGSNSPMHHPGGLVTPSLGERSPLTLSAAPSPEAETTASPTPIPATTAVPQVCGETVAVARLEDLQVTVGT